MRNLPWEVESYLLINWWEMERFSAHDYLAIASVLERLRGFFKKAQLSETGIQESWNLSPDVCQQLATKFQALSIHCSRVGLDVSCKRANSARKILTAEGAELSNHWAAQQFESLQEEIRWEMESQLFLHIPNAQARWYNKTALFGPEVERSFPSVENEIREAGNCYAVNRSTACVFHLMRTIEVGLRALGKALDNPNLDPKRNPTWEAILKPCDDELKKPLAQRAPKWRDDENFFSNATANLRAVKDAWRNPTLHIERDYTQEQALEILNAVKAFMRHLAGRLTD